MYLLDPAGNISFMQGWLDNGEGDSVGPILADKNCGYEPRPIISVNSPECGGDFHFEDWYSLAGGTFLHRSGCQTPA